MLRRPGFQDNYKMRGPLRHLAQREIMGANQVANAAKMYDHIQLNDCENWLLRLGLSRFCAHELAVELLKRPDFDLQNVQQRWHHVCTIMGPNRQADAVALILRELRETLHRPVVEREYPRAPSPELDVNCDENRDGSPLQENNAAVGCNEPVAPNRYALHGMTSTPLSEVKRDRRADHCERNDTRNLARESSVELVPCGPDGNYDDRRYIQQDVYNVHEDPRDFRDEFPMQQPNQNYNYNYDTRNIAREKSVEFVPCGPDGNYDDRRYIQQDVYNVYEDPRDFRDEFPMQQPNQNYNNNYEVPRYLPDNNNGRYCNGEVFNRQPAPYDFPNECPNPHRRDNYDVNYQKPQPREEQDRGHLEMEKPLPQRTGRKRRADPQPEVQVESKKPKANQPRKPEWFKIGDFKMPYLRDNNDPLPQLESKSYAVKFYERKHNYIIGSAEAPPKEIIPKEFPKACNGVHLSRTGNKNIRRQWRTAWINIYRMNQYWDWDLWWKDYKWCEKAIEKELERFEGVNVNGLLLLMKLDYEERRSIERLFQIANENIRMNSNNIQSIVSTIFELTNTKFLEKLTTADMTNLQNLIRYVSNESWLFKMRGMVYLWARYNEARMNISDEYTYARYMLVTHSQWETPVFHWLAKQAFAELKMISQIEWSDHKEKY